MLWLYAWHRHRHPRDLVVVQTLLPAPDIFGMPIGTPNCTWNAADTMMTMLVLLVGRRHRIRFYFAYDYGWDAIDTVITMLVLLAGVAGLHSILI